MFWRRKKLVAVGAETSTTATPAVGEIVAPAKVEATLKTKAEKLPGPREIPQAVGSYLVVTKKRNPDWVWQLKAVVRQNPRGKDVFDVRVFDDIQVAQKRVRVKDWTTFDEHPELVLYEGWYDRKSMQAELEDKKTT